MSVDSAGIEGDGVSYGPALSADGWLVAFGSGATNLVAGDTNGTWDAFVHDHVTGVIERVSVDSSGAEGDAGSGPPAISADGRIVVFFSDATNLVANDANGLADVFVHDRLTGTTECVSVDPLGVPGNGMSGGIVGFPSISADGRFVSFVSDATNLVSGRTTSGSQVFVRDRATGITEIVSVDSSGVEGNGLCWDIWLSTDGQTVAFDSDSTNLVTGDTNSSEDVFVHDRASGLTERVSVSFSGQEANNGSFAPSLSADGHLVAFCSSASNLVAYDTNKRGDVFVHDRTTGGTERVSVSSAGAQANESSFYPALSADGQFVAFFSDSTNLAAGDTNGLSDVFVRDRVAGTTERVSVDSAGMQGNGNSGTLDTPSVSLSADGQTVAFSSDATNLVAADTNGCIDIFLREKCSSPASWSNYGAGFPGTNGVPTFTSQQNPVLGATITLYLSNSYAKPTAGVIFVGLQRTSLHSNWGGDLLVVPAITFEISFSFGGDTFTGTLPDDPSLCGVAIDLQAIEADPGAMKGVSFTPGLELVLGR